MKKITVVITALALTLGMAGASLPQEIAAEIQH